MKRNIMILMIISVIVGIAHLVGVASASVGNYSFSDISGHWAKQAVSDAVYKGYVKGYADGTFKPNQKVTHAEVIKMVTMALQLPIGTSANNWFDPYVNAALVSGIFRYDFAGSTRDIVGWNNGLTRGEICIILVRMSKKDFKDSDYTDTNEGFITAAIKKGFIKDNSDSNYRLKDLVTRAEAVTFIERMLEYRKSI
jgi:hypothetical protein